MANWLKDSITYQIILEEGRAEGEIRGEIRRAQRDVLNLGAQRFGSPDAATASRIERLDSLDALDHMLDSVLHVSSWQELLVLVPE